MAIARYKDLCIDASDPAALGAFYAAALGLELHVDDDGDAHLTGPTKRHTVWINGVPEPKTVKNRVHLDVNTRGVEDLMALGATVLDTSFPWTVMADPEGQELCAFVRDEGAPSLYEVVVDCADHRAQADWWGALLGASITHDKDRGFSWIVDIPGAPFEGIAFVPVAEPKTAKNRVHVDLLAASVDDVIDAGATLLRAKDDEIRWHLVADPEGNELCVFEEAQVPTTPIDVALESLASAPAIDAERWVQDRDSGIDQDIDPRA
jgi:hypothetical protein